MKNTTNHTFDAIEALMLTDAYKLDHRRVYQLAESEGAKIQTVYSNFTNRGSRIPDVDKVVHFGLQAFIQYLDDKFAIFFAADEDEVCELYEKRLAQILGPNDIGSDHIRALHRLGYLPLKFSAVPEGTRVPLRVPSFTVENTHPDFFWLTNYIETIMSAQVWQASTSATIAHRLRGVLEEGALASGGSLEAVNWQGHDFSFRGMSSHETASMSGAGHLLSFFGTDSLSSLQWIDNYYGGEYVAGSVPATEHSVMCAGAATIGEKELFSRILDLYPSGIVSVVSDTFNLWTVLTEFVVDLKDKIMARDGALILRPDSGDPVDILTGTIDLTTEEGRSEYAAKKAAGTLTVEEKGALELLDDVFGSITNEKGFKELDSHIGLIYGDSITVDRAREINARVMAKGFATTNIVYGVGSFTYQYNTRDTFMSAIKATWAKVGDEGFDLQKNPVTGDSMKTSAKGRLAVREENGELVVVQQATPDDEEQSLIQPVWVDGEFVRFQSFADVRDTLASQK